MSLEGEVLSGRILKCFPGLVRYRQGYRYTIRELCTYVDDGKGVEAGHADSGSPDWQVHALPNEVSFLPERMLGGAKVRAGQTNW
jgi:hypothetical protein